MLGNDVPLKGGATVRLTGKTRTCKCGATFEWAETEKKKWIPVVKYNGYYISHFSTCPDANKHRKAKPKGGEA